VTLQEIFDYARETGEPPAISEVEEAADDDLHIQVIGIHGDDLSTSSVIYSEDVGEVRVWTPNSDLVEHWQRG
jgi:hypothetical protein